MNRTLACALRERRTATIRTRLETGVKGPSRTDLGRKDRLFYRQVRHSDFAAFTLKLLLNVAIVEVADEADAHREQPATDPGQRPVVELTRRGVHVLH